MIARFHQLLKGSVRPTTIITHPPQYRLRIALRALRAPPQVVFHQTLSSATGLVAELFASSARLDAPVGASFWAGTGRWSVWGHVEGVHYPDVPGRGAGYGGGEVCGVGEG